MKRIYLRELTEKDVTENYITGFSNDDVIEFLEVDGKNLTQE